MQKAKILWVDDEIDLLKPHVMFLEAKDFEVKTSNNGDEAIDMIRDEVFDIVFLDENMPGLSGLETLDQIKAIFPNLPVVMITKSEEESIMEDAIGSSISDYLIKPVNPNQILLTLKKNLDNKKLVGEKASVSYQQEFRKIGMRLSDRLDPEEWKDLYKQLVYWELQLEKADDEGIVQIFEMQKKEANGVFSKFVTQNYEEWLKPGNNEAPLMSPSVVKERIFPQIKNGKPLFVILIDNLRYDQWKALRPSISNYYRVEDDDLYYSILPTTTQYARNAFFSGLMPLEIQRKYPKFWRNEEDEGSKNQFESELMEEYLKRYGKKIKYSYTKILNQNAGKKLVETLPNLMENDLNFIVYNFVDMLSHARTEMEVIKELADDESAYRSLTVSWFDHSPLNDIFQYLSEKGANIVLTTDHGSTMVKNPVKVVGDRSTTSNLRYKMGKNLGYDHKEVFETRHPDKFYLPSSPMTRNWIFAKENDYCVYPNNYNYYANYYRNTFQHGGISLEEMLIPIISLTPR